MASQVLLLLLLLAAAVTAQSPARATWFAISGGVAPSVTAADMSLLASIGIQRVYVDVWNNGKVFFKSPTMTQLVPNGTAYGGDFLATMVALAQPHSIEVVAWFEYGFMAAYSTPNSFSSVAAARGWLLGRTANNFVYCDPSNGEVLQFLSGLMTDALNGYSVKGVQLDDHFDCPVSFASCSVATMNAAASYVKTNVGSVASANGMIVCIAPTVGWYALQSFSVDWPHWMQQGYFDEIQVQLYFSTLAGYQTNLQATLAQLSSTSNFAAGIRVSGSPVTPWSVVEQMLALSAQQNVNVAVWFAAGILQTYPSEFVSYWGGSPSSSSSS